VGGLIVRFGDKNKGLWKKFLKLPSPKDPLLVELSSCVPRSRSNISPSPVVKSLVLSVKDKCASPLFGNKVGDEKLLFTGQYLQKRTYL
jgi:hypothetical protein